MGFALPAVNSGSSQVGREFWDHIEAVAEQARKGISSGLPSFFRDPAEAPRGRQAKVLLKTATRIVLVGIIFEDGHPGIYDFCSDRYIHRDDWHGISGWMPLPE